MLHILGAIPQELSLYESHACRDCKISQMGVGKVNAARTITQALCETSTQSSFVLIVGTCAGLRAPVGESVATNLAFQHDFILRFDDKKNRVLPGTWWVEEGAPLSQSGYKSSQVMMDAAMKQPNIKKGIILSGDTFLQSQNYAERLINHYGEAAESQSIILDMESAAVAQVCNYYQVPWLCIKTVSDLGNTTSMEDFEKNLLLATDKNYNDVKPLLEIL